MAPTDPETGSPTASSLPVGEMVSCYRIVRQLGRGGMGCVYKAFDTRLGRSVALKTLLPDAAVREAARERFLREARALAVVSNEHVVTVHDVGEHAGRPFLVMEFIRGESLGARAVRCPLSLPQAVKVGRELANGLAAAHGAGVVHRDLKPENVLLDGRRDRAVLIDFGLARSAAGDAPSTAGSAFFMPPEQLLGHSVDARGDLFALGVMLFGLCTGRMPFGSGNPAEWRDRLLSPEPAARADEWNPTIPPPLADLLARLLSKSVAGRPESAVVVERELLDLLPNLAAPVPGLPATPTLIDDPPATVSTPTIPDPPTDRQTIPAKWHGWKFAAALAVAVAGIVTGAVLFWPTTPPDPDPIPIPPPSAPLVVTVHHPDGREMSGWRGVDGQVKAWSFTGEVLAGKADGPEQVLLTREEYTDFILEFQFRWKGKGGHTGLLVRAKDDGPAPDSPAGPSRVSCLMLDIADDEHYAEVHGRPLGRWNASGGLFLFPKTVKAPNKPIGEWNTVRVEASGPRLTVDWNGTRTFDENLSDSSHASKVLPALARSKGAIGLMAHGPQAIEFRRFTIVTLTMN